jgi:opacity protein-like surface antigen
MLISTSPCCLRLVRCLVAFAVVALACSVLAQVVPEATGPRHDALWVGGEYSNTTATYPYGNVQRLWGVGGFADYTLTKNVGIEAELRHQRTNGFYGETQDNYLFGPQYLIGRSGWFQPFAQATLGAGRLQFPLQTGRQIYFVFAPAAGVNFRTEDRWLFHVEYEYQLWQGSSDIDNVHGHDLTPQGVHLGVAFRFK